MMLLRKETFVLLLILTAAQSLPVLAAVQLKAPRAQEVYDAMEEEVDAAPAQPVSIPAQRPVVVRQAAGIARPQPQQVPQALLQPAVVARVAAPAKLPDSGLAYDPVPSDQIDALGRRLQLTDALIRRHGRAYDYRTHTVRDLEMILAKLDASITSSR